MGEASLEDRLRICAACPGICQHHCPVFRALRLRSAAPHMLARAALAALAGDSRVAEALVYCTHCGECVRACPIANPLPDLLLEARRRLGLGLPAASEAVRLRGEGPPLVVASPLEPPDSLQAFIASRGRSVYWLDTRPLAASYWGGGEARASVPAGADVVMEDLDVPRGLIEGAGGKPMDLYDLIELFNLKVEPPPKSVIHIPCKASPRLASMLESLGLPMVKACSGAGGAIGALRPGWAGEAAGAVFSNSGELVVVTPCPWTYEALRRAGMEAHRLLELVAPR